MGVELGEKNMKNKINQTKNTLALLKEDEKDILKGADSENRDLHKGETARLREIRQKIEGTQKELDDLELRQEMKNVKRYYHPGGTLNGSEDEFDREARKFNLHHTVREYIQGRGVTGRARELTDEISRRSGMTLEGIGIPFGSLALSRRAFSQRELRRLDEFRALTAGTATAGGHTIQTDKIDFIDVLRAKNVTVQAGAKVWNGLQGNASFPRKTAASSASWEGETATVSDTDPAFDDVSLTPHRLTTTLTYSQQLLLQSSIDIESMLQMDQADGIASKTEETAIQGSGSGNVPEGILNMTGIGDVAGGTDGAAPDHDDIVDLEGAVALDNADIGSLSYLTNTKVRAKLKKTKVDAGSGVFVWQPNSKELNGYPVFVTNHVPSDLDKGTSTGVCSAIIFGDFSSLYIGYWGFLNVVIDQYSLATSGKVRLTTTTFADINARHVESFAAMQDALTV